MQPSPDALSASPRRHVRRRGLPWAIAGACAVFGLLLAALSGCGKSELELALEAYKPEVERLLAAEGRVWDKVARLSADRLDASRPYFDYVRGDAHEFYTAFVKDVNALEPGHAELDRLHRDLVRVAEGRLEFVVLESRNEAVYAEQSGDPRVQELNQAFAEAIAAETRYRNWVREPRSRRHFDGRFTQLEQLATRWKRLKDQLHTEQLSVAEVQAGVLAEVLRKVQKMRQGKFVSENEKLVREAVVASETMYDLDIQCMPLLDRARRAAAPAQAAAGAAARARERFIKQLRTLLKTVR